MSAPSEPVERVRSPFARPAPGPSAPPATPAPAAAPAAVSAPPPVTRPAALRESLREITGYEEDFVQRQGAGANLSRVCNEVLARCFVAPGEAPGAWLARVRALPIAERDRLLVDLRRLSFGDVVELEAPCPACGEVAGAKVPLSKLPLDVAPSVERLAVDLGDGRTAVAHPPTAGDQEALLDGAYDTPAARRTALLACVLERIGEREGPFSTAEVHALPSRDRAAIEAAVNAETRTIDLSLGMSCPACGHEWAAPLDLRAFFLPS